MSSFEERLNELEIRYAHQNNLVEELNEVITQCDRRIARLERENRMVMEMLRSLAPSLPESPDE